MVEDKYHRAFRQGITTAGIGLTVAVAAGAGSVIQSTIETDTNKLLQAYHNIEQTIDGPPAFSQEAFFEAERSGRNLQAEIAENVTTLYDSLGVLQQQIHDQKPEWEPGTTNNPFTRPSMYILLGGAALTLLGAGYATRAVHGANDSRRTPNDEPPL